MRKIIAFLSVLVVLVSCTAPAFALGNGTGDNVYANLPFEYLAISGYGGPIDYYADHTRDGANLDFSIDLYNSSGTNVADVTGRLAGSKYQIFCTYNLPFAPASGTSTTANFTFGLTDRVAVLQTITGLGTCIKIGNSNYTVTGMAISGNLVVPTVDIYNKITMTTISFAKTFNVEFDDNTLIYIEPFIYSSIPVEYQSTGYLFFRELTLSFYVRRDNSSASVVPLSISIGEDAITTADRSVGAWWSSAIKKVNVENSFTGGTMLSDFMTHSVTAFLDFELFPGFSLSKILVMVLVVSIFIWFTKIIS